MKLRNEISWGELLKTSLPVIRVSSARMSSGAGSEVATFSSAAMSPTSAAASAAHHGPPARNRTARYLCSAHVLVGEPTSTSPERALAKHVNNKRADKKSHQGWRHNAPRLP